MNNTQCRRSILSLAVFGLGTVALAIGSLGCSKPEAKVKGMWVGTEESSAYVWNRSLSFIVYYFDGKGNVGADCQKLWSRGWDADEPGCFSVSGTYKVEGDILAIDTPRYQVRYNFERRGDKLLVWNVGHDEQPHVLFEIKEHPWVTYKDTSRFIHNGKVDHSFFKAWEQPK